MKSSLFVQQNSMDCSFTGSDSWTILSPIELSIKRKIEAVGTPLKDWDVKIYRGILTGCNEAFIINAEKRQEILNNCRDDEERRRTDELIRPILRGRDIKRYGYDWANLYLIATFPSRHYDIEQYPAIKKHFLTFDRKRLAEAGREDLLSEKKLNQFCRDRLEQTGSNILVDGVKIIIDGKLQKSRKQTGNKWFETQDQIGYWDDFDKPKIVWAETMRIKRENDERFPRFSYIESSFYTDKTCFIAIGASPFFTLAILNSMMGRYQLSQTVAMMDNGGYLMQKIYLETLRVPAVDRGIEKSIEKLVKKLLGNTISSCEREATETTIDQLVFLLFNITKKEQEYISAVCSKKLGTRTVI